MADKHAAFPNRLIDPQAGVPIGHHLQGVRAPAAAGPVGQPSFYGKPCLADRALDLVLPGKGDPRVAGKDLAVGKAIERPVGDDAGRGVVVDLVPRLDATVGRMLDGPPRALFRRFPPFLACRIARVEDEAPAGRKMRRDRVQDRAPVGRGQEYLESVPVSTISSNRLPRRTLRASPSTYVTPSPPGRRRATSSIAPGGSTPNTSRPSERLASSPLPQPRSSTERYPPAKRRQKSKSTRSVLSTSRGRRRSAGSPEFVLRP